MTKANKIKLHAVMLAAFVLVQGCSAGLSHKLVQSGIDMMIKLQHRLSALTIAVDSSRFKYKSFYLDSSLQESKTLLKEYRDLQTAMIWL